MKFWEAIRELEAGKKITHRGWGDSYIWLDGKVLRTMQNRLYNHDVNTLLSLDNAWGIYEEKLVPFSTVPIGEWCQFSDNDGYLMRVEPFIWANGQRNAIAFGGGKLFVVTSNINLVKYPVEMSSDKRSG